MTYVHAAELVRAEEPASLMPDEGHLAVDGLDEIASPGTGSALDAVLEQLREMNNPPFILSCRTAEWRDAADRARIEDSRAGEAVTLYLAPFSDDEAQSFLEHEFPGAQVHALLQNLKNRRLAHACRNPLVLHLFGEAVRRGSGLPETRTELFARACRAMLDRDDRHGPAQLARRDEDDLLLASGAICATLLLRDLLGMHDGPRAETPAGFLNVADMEGLPFASAAADALATRMFRAGGEGRFSYVHRALAEYLGARWLTCCIGEGRSGGRILSLFSWGGDLHGCSPVPTALRGLHAWIARLSPALAGRCIAADPYAVLRDGGAETLDLDRARALLAALRRRSGEDPCFDAESGGVRLAFGLMRRELEDDILEIVAAPGRHAHVSALLIDAMGATDLSAEARLTLEGVMFDPAREYRERAGAFRSLGAADALAGEEEAILRLLDMGDGDSARLACEMLVDLAWFAAPPPADPAAAPSLKHAAGLDSESAPARADRGGEFATPDPARLAALLDFVAAGAPAMAAEADEMERSALADTVRRLAARVLEADPAPAPQRVWAWICWTNEGDGEGDDARERLAAVFRRERALRAALLEHVLLKPGAGGIWMACLELEATGLGLRPDGDDFAGVLKASRTGVEDGTVDPETRQELAGFAQAAAQGAPLELDEAIAMAGAGREAMAESGETDAGSAVQQAARSLRRSLSEEADAIAAGDVRVLALPAAVYLGRFDAFGGLHWDPAVTPAERLREFLGDDLSARVLDGFVAVLGRGDLPGASEIAHIHCADREHEVEAPLLCGIDVALGRGLPFDGVERATLEAAYMAWQRAPRSASDGRLHTGSTLEAMVLRSLQDVERHFRASIEPQLACNADYVEDLDRLAAEYGFGFDGLAGRLAIEWLRAWPALNGDTQGELLTCALENAAPRALRDLVADCGGRAHPDERTRLGWLSVACVVDPEGSRSTLLAAAEDSPEFIGHVRERIGKIVRFADVPLASLVFVVEAFGACWPKTPDVPGSGAMGPGWNDPRDASAFIERTFYAIGSRPEPEAGDALESLVENHAPSYADTAKLALAFQRRVRRDCGHTVPAVADLRILMAETLEGTGSSAGPNSGSDAGSA